MKIRLHKLALGLWLALMLGSVLVISQTRFVADLSAFMPKLPSARQQMLIDQLRAAPLNYRDCLRLFFNDAATGTRNGSVHLPCAPARLPPSRCCR